MLRKKRAAWLGLEKSLLEARPSRLNLIDVPSANLRPSMLTKPIEIVISLTSIPYSGLLSLKLLSFAGPLLSFSFSSLFKYVDSLPTSLFQSAWLFGRHYFGRTDSFRNFVYIYTVMASPKVQWPSIGSKTVQIAPESVCLQVGPWSMKIASQSPERRLRKLQIPGSRFFFCKKRKRERAKVETNPPDN